MLTIIRKKSITRLETTVMMETSLSLPALYIPFVGSGRKKKVCDSITRDLFRAGHMTSPMRVLLSLCFVKCCIFGTDLKLK